jgi:hypothetical protein
MEFLNIGVSARNAGTGEALSALSEGAVASYYNPAGLAQAKNYQIAAMHAEWLQDLRYEYLGMAMPTGQVSNIGMSFSYLSLGEISGYSPTNSATGNIKAYDWSLGLSYGRRMTERLSLGLGAKVVSERLDDVSATGYAGDIGAQYRMNKFDLGLAVMNIGPNIKYDQLSSPLPSRVETGISYRPWGDELAILAGAGAPFRGDISMKAGLEYTYAGALVIRGGFDLAERYDERSGFSFGSGIRLSQHSIDYAYNVNNLLGGTHQFSFVIRFGEERQESFHSDMRDQQSIGSEKPNDSSSSVTRKAKMIYSVCAGRYGTRADAEKHVSALEKFGYSPKIEMVGPSDFRVVLVKADSRLKAEKKKKEYEDNGIPCFVEEK